MNQHAEEDHELGLFHVVCSWFNTVKYDNEKTLQLILYGKTYKSYLLSGNYIRKNKDGKLLLIHNQKAEHHYYTFLFGC